MDFTVFLKDPAELGFTDAMSLLLSREALSELET